MTYYLVGKCKKKTLCKQNIVCFPPNRTHVRIYSFTDGIPGFSNGNIIINKKLGVQDNEIDSLLEEPLSKAQGVIYVAACVLEKFPLSFQICMSDIVASGSESSCSKPAEI